MSSSPGARHPMSATRRRFFLAAGGRVRGRVLFLLACVLALATADTATIGAIAGRLETSLSLSNTELGLLVAVPSLAAAVATVPIGMLSDRVNRVRLTAASVILWSVAMLAGGLAQSFGMLLLTRLALGAATATAGPTISSLVGDFFAPPERGRVYGLILSGELLGAGFGFVVSGELSSALSWRAAFFVLAVPSVALGVALWRLLPEPLRGGASRLEPGATRFVGADQPAQSAGHRQRDARQESVVQQQVEQRHIAADEDLVLHEDPARMNLWAASRYVLRVRTNVVLILASALGYFYLGGVETFGVVYFRGHYGLSQPAATLLLVLFGAGSLVGVVAGGRIADRLVARGTIDGRILVGAVSSLAATVLFLPALLTGSLVISMPLFVLAAVAFSARNPVLDAARLDIMHHRLWGRAEAIRTLFRQLMVTFAPLLFGFIGDRLGSGRAAASSQHGFGAGASAAGLQDAFLILLVTLLVGGLLTFRARSTYPVDVATAVASEDAVRIGP